MENIKSYVQQHKDRFINELIELLKIPSVSADTAYCQDVIDTADAVKESLEKAKALRQSILKKAFEGKLLSAEELAKCKADQDYEPASVLLEKIKKEKKKNCFG